MKYLVATFGLLLMLALLVLGLQYLASERIEVVELHTRDSTGAEVTTRLWVVDDDGYTYLRAGSGGSGWSERVLSQPSFELTRNGVRASYRAQPRAGRRERVNQLMREKYTWGDRLISLLAGSREAALPLELQRLD